MARIVLGKTRAIFVGDNSDVLAVKAQADALKQAVVDGGGSWDGWIELALDEPDEIAAEPVPAVEPSVPHEDPIHPDDAV